MPLFLTLTLAAELRRNRRGEIGHWHIEGTSSCCLSPGMISPHPPRPQHQNLHTFATVPFIVSHPLPINSTLRNVCKLFHILNVCDCFRFKILGCLFGEIVLYRASLTISPYLVDFRNEMLCCYVMSCHVM